MIDTPSPEFLAPLTKNQRACYAAEREGSPGELARLFGVGETMVGLARRIARINPGLFERVRSGEILLEGANRETRGLPAHRYVAPSKRVAEVAALAAEGLRSEEIAKRIGIVNTTVRAIAKKHGIDLSNRVITAEVRRNRPALLRQLAADGYNSDQIAEQLGIGPSSVRELARREKVELADTRVRMRRLDPLRTIENTVQGLEGFAQILRALNGSHVTVTPEVAREWSGSLTRSLSVINKLRWQLRRQRAGGSDGDE